jgi:RNA polymerase sigma-70 factor (ECF subfamily)
MSKEQIITQWVEQHGDDLYRWAFAKVGDRQAAEDLVQDTFLGAMQGFERFRREASPKTYLMGILRNQIAAHFRRQYRDAPEPSPGAAERADAAFSEQGHWTQGTPHAYDNLLDDPDFAKQLAHCMASLPEKWGLAVRAKFLLEKSGDEVCRQLGLTPANYWQIVRRAKLLLKQCIDSHWFHYR